MRPEQMRSEINGLELSEKLLLVEDIWDAIAASNSALPMPEWQKAELDRRYETYRDGYLMLHDWAAVHERLREKIQMKLRYTDRARDDLDLAFAWYERQRRGLGFEALIINPPNTA